jgi:hypothetical protein
MRSLTILFPVADIPPAAVIRADSAHWKAAIRALIRAVAFDGLDLYHPAVLKLLGILAPVAKAEVAHNKAFDAVMSKPERHSPTRMLPSPLHVFEEDPLVEPATRGTLAARFGQHVLPAHAVSRGEGAEYLQDVG